MTKSILLVLVSISLIASSACAAPSILAVPRPYVAAQHQGIRWEILLTQHDPAYTGSLSVELPFTLGAHNGPAFPQTMQGIGVDDTNGTTNTTWYYNETAAASGVLLWNITDPPNAADHTQNPGDNPFTLSETDGLEVDAANRRLFASLGSTVGLPDALSGVPGKQIRLMHVATTDGILNWNNAIVAENGVQYTLSGSANSIIPMDLNASGNRNPTTGAFVNPITTADIPNFRRLLDPGFGPLWYNMNHPGLNGAKRGDCNGNGTTTTADIPCFRALLNPIVPFGAGSESGAAIPEPASITLFGLALLSMVGLVRHRS